MAKKNYTVNDEEEHITRSRTNQTNSRNKIKDQRTRTLQRTRAKNQHGQRITSSRNKLKGQRTRTQLMTTTQDRRTTSTTKNAFTKKEQKQETNTSAKIKHK